jgi:GNAT superfamily N-acetyltransferase
LRINSGVQVIDVRHLRALHLLDFAPVIDAGFDRVSLGVRVDAYRAVSFKPNMRAIAAYRGDKIIGALYWRRWSGMAFICLAFVLPRYRRRGVYRMMIEALRQLCQVKGISHVMSAVDDKNIASLSAHERLGFVEPIHYLKLALKS